MNAVVSQERDGRPAPPTGGSGVARLRALAPATLAIGVGLAVLVALVLIHVAQGQASIRPAMVVEALVAPNDSTAHAIIRHVRLPRVTVGILAGAALAMAGVLLQTVMHNSLASPSTVGVNAGAYLALVAATVFAPATLDLSPLVIAFAGGLGAAMLVYSIAASVSATPVRLTLAGIAVAFTFAALTAALQLLYENETAGLFFWGAGSLLQTDWSGVSYAWPRLVIAIGAALLIAGDMDVLRLGDETARGLGQRVALTRLGGTAIGVFLAAISVSVVGPIGFVGLVVPHLVRLMGCVRHRVQLIAAGVWGATLLIGADVLARLIAPGMSEIPAGVVTALLGAPFLVWLIRRAAGSESGDGRVAQRGNSVSALSSRLPTYSVTLTVSIVMLLVTLAAGVTFGAADLSPTDIWAVFAGAGTDFARRVVFDLRLPRLLVAICAGAALAVSGVILQGIVRNPLAAPSVVGVTSGAGLGGLTVLVVLPAAPIELVPLAAFAGAFLAFGIAYAAAWDHGITPARLALMGIAVSAVCLALVNLLVVKADVRVAVALAWLAGSTYARGWSELLRLVAWPTVLIPLAWLIATRLDTLSLGDDVARGLGMRLERARLALLSIAVALAAAAVSIVGTIGFVGLMAPHAARLLVGTKHRRLLPLAAVLGAILVTAADTIGRVALAPKEIPAGLVTALIGTPYFLWLLYRSS